MSIYRRTLQYFRPYMLPSMGGVIFSLLAIGFNLLTPWPFRYIIDGILTPATNPSTLAAHATLARYFGSMSPSNIILWLCVSLVVIKLFWGIANLISNYLFINVGLQGLLRLRTELYAYLQSLPLKYHDTRRSADSSFRVAYDSQSIQTIYNKGFTGVFASIIFLVAAVVIMLLMDWKLTLVSLLVLPPVMMAIHYFSSRIRSQSTTIQERESDLLTIAQEGLSAIRMVQAFGREDFEVHQFHTRASQSLQANLKLSVTSVKSALLVGTLMAVGTALVYYLGSLQVLHTQTNNSVGLTLGDLVVFATYVLMLYTPLEQLTYTAWALEGATAGARRCFEVLDKVDDVSDAPDAQQADVSKGEIEFRNVAFGYTDEMIIKDVSLSIKPGENVAFVGGTGAGKSTLLSLVPRFYDPNAGSVFLDGKDLRTLTKKSLRAQVSIVLQDTLLFSTTIRENIAYGRPDATEEEIIQAAKSAQAYDFIMKLPDGFESQVGERGGHLSVGQRQRLGIARAFLKDAPILLLDEPTSALDPATENAIMQTLGELMKGRTTLIITHRIATIHHMDKIAVLKNGGVAEVGSGVDLLAQGGEYAHLYRSANY
ncbi:MAG: ABC transporter ATP-binding protein [Chthoniobacterales bacterium]